MASRRRAIKRNRNNDNKITFNNKIWHQRGGEHKQCYTSTEEDGGRRTKDEGRQMTSRDKKEEVFTGGCLKDGKENWLTIEEGEGVGEEGECARNSSVG